MAFYYVYVLLSLKDRKVYSGFSGNLRERVRFHNEGGVNSTRERRPLRLIFYEAYLSSVDAKRREKYLKTSAGRTTLRTMLRKYLSQQISLAPM